MTNIDISTEDIAIKVTHPNPDNSALIASLDSHDNYFLTVTVDGETSHRIGDLYHAMKRIADGTVHESDTYFKLLRELDDEWVEINGVTRESFRN